jgi:lysozyme
MKTTSAVGQALIRHFEQCRLTGYLCPAGVPTIGWGHTGPEVRVGMKITQQQADALFEQDLRKREAQVFHLVNVHLTQGQWDALVSFEYNLGEGNLASSTLLEKVNAGDFRGAALEFPRWCHSGGEVLEGLVLRRKAEQQLFLTGMWSIPQ